MNSSAARGPCHPRGHLPLSSDVSSGCLLPCLVFTAGNVSCNITDTSHPPSPPPLPSPLPSDSLRLNQPADHPKGKQTKRHNGYPHPPPETTAGDASLHAYLPWNTRGHPATHPPIRPAGWPPASQKAIRTIRWVAETISLPSDLAEAVVEGLVVVAGGCMLHVAWMGLKGGRGRHIWLLVLGVVGCVLFACGL